MNVRSEIARTGRWGPQRTSESSVDFQRLTEALVSDDEKRQANGLIRSLGRLEQALGMMPYFARMPAPYPEVE